ncbi:uncharacterized protein TNCV_3824471 [Trichonephila clavipes]|nr:uncharacterized protein TNCV_3824471 [Trichonephila clavipes]
MCLLSGNVEHSLKPFPHLMFSSFQIHFQTDLLIRVSKGLVTSEFTRQIALQTIHGIPHSALKIYTDGSTGYGGISGSSVHIEIPDDTVGINIRNINYCFVFRSELITIYKGLKFIDTASLTLSSGAFGF